MKRIRDGHSLAYPAEYSIWQGIKQRCTNPRRHNYKYYGGIGIGICDEWRESFQAFIAYVGARPSPAHSIDRFPDNKGDYEPGNVRWATKSEQNENTKRTHSVMAFGETKALSTWLRQYGIKRSAFGVRIRLGWSIEKALCTPARAFKRAAKELKEAV